MRGEAVDEQRLLLVPARRDPVHPLGQLDVRLVGRDRKADVGEPVELGPHRVHDGRVPVTGHRGWHGFATAPPNEPEKRLWILMYSWSCGSRSPKLVTSDSWKPQ